MKTKSVYLVTSLIALLMLLFSSCRESSLSDIEIDDPTILKIFATAEKYTNPDSTVIEKHILSLRIKDKTDHSVELKKGKVLCNNIEMESHSDLLGPYYKIPSGSLEITDNTLYTFVVELADEEQYPSNVYIADSHLESLNAPSSWTWVYGDSLKILWNKPSNDYSSYIYWHIIVKEDATIGDKATWGWIDVTEVNEYKFPGKFFTNDLDENIADEFRIELRSEKEGELNDNFYRGNVTARFTIVKEITIK